MTFLNFGTGNEDTKSKIRKFKKWKCPENILKNVASTISAAQTQPQFNYWLHHCWSLYDIIKKCAWGSEYQNLKKRKH